MTPDRDFDGFFVESYPGVARALYLALGSSEEAEDAAQEVFARAFRKWDSVAQMERPGTWVFVVAVREGRRVRRKRSRELFAARAGRDEIDPAEHVTLSHDLERALGGLSSRQRFAVVLRFYADLTNPQIARIMKCREGTVKATIHAALGRLREAHVDEQIGEPDG